MSEGKILVGDVGALKFIASIRCMFPPGCAYQKLAVFKLCEIAMQGHSTLLKSDPIMIIVSAFYNRYSHESFFSLVMLVL